VADQGPDRRWRGTEKRSPGKATRPCAKQVYRHCEGGEMRRDVIALYDERAEGTPLLVPAMRSGHTVLRESLDEMRARSYAELSALPDRLRAVVAEAEPYPVELSPALTAA
jgi:nicotinate phosphoribosyltransferase